MDVADVVMEAITLLRATLPSSIQIRQHLSQMEFPLFGDPTQIHQVVMNLCTNAAQAMKDGKGAIDISLAPFKVDGSDVGISKDLSPGEHMRLSVRDTGYGMNPGIIEKIFDPFFTTKKPEEGTGLGLSVVYGIVKAHGGGITVQSEPGKGAEFNVYLPLTKQFSTGKVHVQEGADKGGHGHILFVDDETSIVDVAGRVLTSLGYRVTSCSDPARALAMFRKNPEDFDLVITDMTMPGMTGMELAQSISRCRKDMPVIICTGFSDKLKAEDFKRLGIRDVLLKPISKKEFSKTIEHILDTVRHQKDKEQGEKGI